MPPLTDTGLSVLLVYKKKRTVLLKPEHLKRIVNRGCIPKPLSSPVGRSSISATISCTEQPLHLVAEQHPCDEHGLQAGPVKRAFKRLSSSKQETKKLIPFWFIIKALLGIASSSSCWCQHSSTSEKVYYFGKWLTTSLQIFSHLLKKPG